ncbi:MAG TPA: acetoin utilization protein AcuC [Chloroflexia bacterium]|nr:acetoin utilization protein AcuC [Chloroflexia bacterium]
MERELSGEQPAVNSENQQAPAGATQLAVMYGPAHLAYDFGPEHPFGANRAYLTHALMQQIGLLDAPQVQLVTPVEADREDLLLFHTRDLIEFVQNACVRGYGYLDGGDTPAVEGGFEAALTVVGGTLKVVDMLMRNQTRYAIVPVGGLHHGHPGRASGFCIFNDIAIAIKRLQADYGIERIAYVDMDAHHGDGVVYGFYDDPSVLTIDFHEDGRYLFPGTGEMHEIGRGLGLGKTINLPMPPYSSDHSFIYAFDEIVPEALRRFKPQLIMMVAGVDGHGGDPLSDMNYSSASYLHAARSLRQLAAELCDDRLIVFGAGGYNPATCALRWTEIAASLADFTIPDFLPAEWRAKYKARTQEEAPVTFMEDSTSDNTFERVEKIVTWLKQKIFI